MGDLLDEGLRAADVLILEVFVTNDFQSYCVVSEHPQLPSDHDWFIATQETDVSSLTPDEPSPDDDCFV
jgi:hypothetical protein